MNPSADIDAFTEAQTQGFRLMNHILKGLDAGISEVQLLEYIEQEAKKFGFTDWFSRPVIHFDYTMRTRIGPSKNRKLTPLTVVQIHLKPATEHAYANLGLSFCLNGNPPPIISQARELTKATTTFAAHMKCIGELFVFARSWANNHRCKLNNETHIGHECTSPSPNGWLWPKSARLAALLRRNQVQWYNPRRLNGVYAIQPDLSSDGRRAGFAEIIAVTEEGRWALGRESMDEIGHWEVG